MIHTAADPEKVLNPSIGKTDLIVVDVANISDEVKTFSMCLKLLIKDGWLVLVSNSHCIDGTFDYMPFCCSIMTTIELCLGQLGLHWRHQRGPDLSDFLHAQQCGLTRRNKSGISSTLQFVLMALLMLISTRFLLSRSSLHSH